MLGNQLMVQKLIVKHFSLCVKIILNSTKILFTFQWYFSKLVLILSRKLKTTIYKHSDCILGDERSTDQAGSWHSSTLHGGPHPREPSLCECGWLHPLHQGHPGHAHPPAEQYPQRAHQTGLLIRSVFK